MTSLNEDVYYSIMGMFFKEIDNIPHLRLDAGKNGRIQYERNTRDQVIIKFNPIECTKCSMNDREARIFYEIFYADSEFNLNALGKCGI